VLTRFPGAEIVDVRTPAGTAALDELPLAPEGAGDPADEER
jgi:hypothetical protein